MITPLLEHAILTGKGRVRTHVHAVSGNSEILVPDDTYVIIHNIVYFFFIDVQPDFIFNLQTRSYSQLRIASKSGASKFWFKDEIYSSSTLDEQDQPITANVVNGHANIDTYLLHSDTVNISVLKPTDITTAPPLDSGVLPNTVAIAKTPVDYGNDSNSLPPLQLVEGFYMDVNNGFNPQTRDFNPVNGIGAANMANDGNIPATPATAVNIPDQNEVEDARQFPIINIQMVEIDQQWINTLKPPA